MFSGDVVQSGDDEQAYSEISSLLDEKLNAIGISKGKRICVPGNHDVATTAVEANKIIHEGGP